MIFIFPSIFSDGHGSGLAVGILKKLRNTPSPKCLSLRRFDAFVTHTACGRSFARWRLCLRNVLSSMERFLVRGVALSMAGNARKGPHCIGIVFLCQEWRLGGLFFAGWNFAMKPGLNPIRQNVFLVAGHSAFLELLTLQKGPIVPLSATTPLLGRTVRIIPRCVAHRLSSARCRRPPSSVAYRSSFVVCNPPPDALRFSSGAFLRPRDASRRLLRASATPYRRMLNLRCSPAALTPLKHTLHFAVTCVSRS